ncbi:hypothetical protein [Chitinivorax sp. B]|uniref:hypothetical protein n=1 Tax=Chitinivorax sp. B TaxID=2502235 RepID=UPI0010F7BA5F|nr:hypothetical protein [Chitinivorax sp. B]
MTHVDTVFETALHAANQADHVGLAHQQYIRDAATRPEHMLQNTASADALIIALVRYVSCFGCPLPNLPTSTLNWMERGHERWLAELDHACAQSALNNLMASPVSLHRLQWIEPLQTSLAVLLQQT